MIMQKENNTRQPSTASPKQKTFEETPFLRDNKTVHSVDFNVSHVLENKPVGQLANCAVPRPGQGPLHFVL